MSEEGAKEWNYPKPPDNSTILPVNKTIELRWTRRLQELVSENIPFADVTHIDLWLVDTQSRSKIHQIYSDYDLSAYNAYDWNCSIPDQEVATVDLWEFNFVEHEFSPLDTAEYLRSPQFSIRSSPSESPTSVSTTQSTSAPSSMIMTLMGISPATSAGIAVGSAIAAVICTAACWYLARWLTKRKGNKEATTYPQPRSSLLPAPRSFSTGDDAEKSWIQPQGSLQPDQRQVLQTISDANTLPIATTPVSYPTLDSTSRAPAIEMPGQ